MRLHNWLVGIFLLLTLCLDIYSYTQVDLNLTLSGNPLYQSVQKQLTFIGYFNRSLSGVVFLVLLLSLFSFYLYCLRVSTKKILSEKTFKWLIVISALLVLAYPAFSHDFFNYMFDARVVTTYGLDPHFFKALDFPLDPWTRFMRWTHRYYPYGPGWLWLTLIPSYLGMGKFVLTLGLFKLMFLIFHLGNIWLIGKLAGQNVRTEALVFYAFNPLVLLESLVSPHNEVVMLFFSLTAIYLLVKKKTIHAIIALAVSISIKYLSVALLALFWFVKPVDRRFYRIAFWLWAITLIPVVLQREPYSWYMVPLVGIAALTDSKIIKMITLSITTGLLVSYFPFLWWGEYTIRTQIWQLWSIIFGIVVSVIVSLGLWGKI